MTLPTELLLSGLLRDAFTEAPALPPAADRAAARARWLMGLAVGAGLLESGICSLITHS